MTKTPRRGRRNLLGDVIAPQSARQPPQSVLSVAAAAERAGVCARTVKRWIAAGLLAATRLPSPSGRGHLRIRVGDLEALLARGTLG
jgi:excisionase family DNA binding protein